jgi:rSAM/selenodomain-associated transferase 2
MLSVIVPTLNAADHLPACLAALEDADEIVVVDGGSVDESVAIATSAGAKVILTHKGRGTQLRAGAEATKGDWLLFIHADTKVQGGWRRAVEAHVATRPDQAACFRFRLDDAAWQARLIEAGAAARVRLLGLPYGDQGLLVSRQQYEAVNGYRPLPLMEDVDLARRLGPIRILGVDAVTSAVRWRTGGWARRSALNLLCLGLYRAGMSPVRIAKLYGS